MDMNGDTLLTIIYFLISTVGFALGTEIINNDRMEYRAGFTLKIEVCLQEIPDVSPGRHNVDIPKSHDNNWASSSPFLSPNHPSIILLVDTQPFWAIIPQITFRKKP